MTTDLLFGFIIKLARFLGVTAVVLGFVYMYLNTQGQAGKQ